VDNKQETNRHAERLRRRNRAVLLEYIDQALENVLEAVGPAPRIVALQSALQAELDQTLLDILEVATYGADDASKEELLEVLSDEITREARWWDPAPQFGGRIQLDEGAS